MSSDILIHRVEIHRAGEQLFFQLNVPRDVTQIIGIITGVQLMDAPLVSGTGQVGFLQLQATGRASGCYNSIVKLEPVAALKTDLGLKAYQAGFTKPNALLLNGLSQRGLSSPETIFLPPCNCFYGNYKDLLGQALGQNVNYRISITFWTTKQKL